MAALMIQDKPYNRGQLAPTVEEQLIEDSDLMNPDTSISNEQQSLSVIEYVLYLLTCRALEAKYTVFKG